MLTLRVKFFILFLSIVTLAASGDDSLDTTCTPALTKMYSCLDYSTGKTATPSTDCCTSVEDVRKSTTVCLCYIIQQTHDGSLEAKSMGIRFDRIFSLPSECKMANTTISNCPKLLNLSPTSPDYKIFTTNSSTANSTVTPTASNGTKHGGSMLQCFSSITALLSAILLSIF